MPSHKWHLVVSNTARRDIDQLPTSKDLMHVFSAMRLLLLAENPTLVPGVRKLVEKRFAGQWRQRSGDWRIFFTVDPKEVTHLKHTYKGTVTIVSVTRREHAYE